MDVEKMFDTAVREIERILSTKTVIGEPMTVDGRTMIPLLSVGFGFGAGGGAGSAPSGQGEGSGGGVGGGGGVRPVGLLVVDDEGVHLGQIGKTGALERMATTVGELVAKQRTGGGAKQEPPR